MPANSRRDPQTPPAPLRTRIFRLVASVAMVPAAMVAATANPPGGGQPAAVAPEQISVADPATADPAKLRAMLRGGTFEQRQYATRLLWRDREENRETVIAALADSDPEVAGRARWVLDRWKRGILPDTPPELVQRLEAVGPPDVISVLLDYGRFDGAVVAIDEAVASGDHGTLSRAAAVIHRAFPFYIRKAHDQGKLEAFSQTLDRLAAGEEMLISSNQLRRALGLADPGTDQAVSVRHPNLSRADRERMKVVAAAAGNSLDEAFRAAQQSEDPELLRVCRMLRGDWAELTYEQLAAARAAPANSTEANRHWAYALIGAVRSGNEAVREESIRQLSAHRGPADAPVATDEAERDILQGLRWRVLAMHGEIDAAVELLTPDQPTAAAEVLAQAGRLDEAMELLDLPSDAIDRRLPEMMREAAEATARWSPSQLNNVPEALNRVLAAGRLLFLSGRRDAAWEIFHRLATADSDEESEFGNLSPGRIIVMQSLTRINRDWLVRLIVSQEESELSPDARSFLARAFDVQPETLGALLAALPEAGVEENAVIEALVDFLRGDVPHGFDPTSDYERLFKVLTDRERPREMRRRRGAMEMRGGRNLFALQDSIELNLEIATLFETHGRIELAKKMLVQLAAGGDIEALLKLAETELQEGRVHSAEKLFAGVWERLSRQRRDPSRLNRAEDDAQFAMRAILGEATAASRSGDVESADQLWQLIDLMMCSPSAKLRYSFAEHLLDQGFSERAETIFRVLIPWTAFGTDENITFYSLVHNFHRAASDRDPEAAAAVFDLAIAGTIESTVYYPGAYITLPAFVKRKQIMAAISGGDEDSAARRIDALLKLNPIDIDFGEKGVAALREAGMEELADRTLERIHAAARSHLDRFPLDFVTSNNLAWILALSDHRVEEALKLSRRAVFSSPDSTVYRDTLAEVLFRLGRVDEAIAVQEACLLDEPGEYHLHEQLRRFRAAVN